MDEVTSNVNEQQQKYYKLEWQSLELSDQPERSGWRTNVPAPDFLEFIEWLKQHNISGRALDLGCGGGRHSIVLAKNGFQVTGVDFAEAAINLSAKNAAEAGVTDSTHFVVGDALDLQFDDSYFDVVNDDGCLHHISPDDWTTYASGVKKVIRPGGILRIKAFSKNCDYFIQNSPTGSQWVKLEDSGYTYFFTDDDIRELFGRNFKVINLQEKAHTQANDKRFFFVVLESL